MHLLTNNKDMERGFWKINCLHEDQVCVGVCTHVCWLVEEPGAGV